jgi:hypothetical protein
MLVSSLHIIFQEYSSIEVGRLHASIRPHYMHEVA